VLASYASGIISQWDEQLMAKEALCKEQKAKLLSSYNDLLSDMDGLLTNATESASGLAERSFESKRRDFQRFLERAKSRFSQVYSGDLEMLRQFRRFCVNWLNVFKECSIDPVGRPTEVVDPEELENQTTIVEVADLCLERLRVTEVRFISAQRDKDKNMIDHNQRDFKRHRAQQGAKKLAITAGGEEEPPKLETGASTPQPSRTSWLRCGSGGQCKCSGYPSECTFLCGSVVCLSQQHTTIMFLFFVGGLVIALDIFNAMSAQATGINPFDVVALVCAILAEICVVVVLINFEDLDTVQKLEREVQELEAQNKAVSEQREKMKEFWASAQNLTELWLYRTVPRLDLYKELHSQLEDEAEEDLLTHISGANDALQNLEGKLGALEYWRNDGKLKTEDKKLFGKTVNELCQIGQFGEMLLKLEDDVINGNVMKRLQG